MELASTRLEKFLKGIKDMKFMVALEFIKSDRLMKNLASLR